MEQIKKPLENYRDIDVFKIYVSDLGLLCAKKDVNPNDVLYMVEGRNDFRRQHHLLLSPILMVLIKGMHDWRNGTSG